MASADAERNRAFWNRDSDDYQRRNAAHIDRHDDPAWGLWQIPESELDVLGDVAGKDVLELGCGAAQWGIALARRGARVTGLDVSERQLEHAREAGADFPLVCASAEEIPLADASFDVVFCDWGATTFTDPYRTVPEVARVLRPGGLFAFSGGTAIEWVCYDERAQRPGAELERPYFGLHRMDLGDHVEYMLGYGDWIRLFVASGLEVLDLVEPQPSAEAQSTYRDDDDRAWARQWPMEQIWRVRKR
jgi:SAM-dependent methyltransferase